MNANNATDQQNN